jgi:hypothetical protein
MKGFKEIPWKPGRWIDFSDLKNIVIRDENYNVVATDLHITEEDFEKLKQKLTEMTKTDMKRTDK